MSGAKRFASECPVGGCDGTYRLETVEDNGETGHRRVVTTCEHTLIICESCREPRPAEDILFSLRPGVNPPAGKSVLCEKCVRANRVYSLSGWGR